MISHSHARLVAAAIAGALPWAGCAAPDDGKTASVDDAWRDRRPRDTAAEPAAEQAPPVEPVTFTDALPVRPGPGDQDIVAVVDGRPIPRRKVVNLIMQSHGVGVLEQLIALEAARHRAEKLGLTIEEVDVHFEFDLALRRLSDPLAGVSSGSFDRAAAQRALDAVLAERNISRDELFVTLRRNAYLRKIVRRELTFTDEQLRAEFDRAYSQRVEIRHIQLATASEAARVQERLAAGGDFAELATQFSANVASGQRGGLLDPFSAGDEAVPALFRRTAFGLQIGEASDILRVGEWYHLIRVERILPAQSVSFEEVRDDLERRLGERVAEERMRGLYEDLLKNASIVIHDPALEEQFEARHPERRE
jgi:foldase protein PrsA